MDYEQLGRILSIVFLAKCKDDWKDLRGEELHDAIDEDRETFVTQFQECGVSQEEAEDCIDTLVGLYKRDHL